MRLGQIKHILNTVTNDNNHLELKVEPVANGGYYKILNLDSIILAIDALADNNLIEPIDVNSEKAINNADISGGITLMTSQDYNVVRNYLASINIKVANALDVINKLVKDQPEDVINIMVPNDVDSFDSLKDVHSRIIKVLKSFKVVENNIVIVGFDTGSKWYQIKIKDKKFIVTTIIAAISLAIQISDYVDSLNNDPQINIQVETMNINIEEETGKDGTITKDSYIENLVRKKISQIVKEYVEKLNEEQLEGETPAAYCSMVEKGVLNIYKERTNGLIFDPSLNPPDIINSDERLRYRINYEKLQELGKPNDKRKELDSGRKTQESSGE